jgi:adenylate kinase
LVRAEVENESEMGSRVAATVASGDLVPVEDVLGVLEAPLVAATRAGGWVLDGIPRTVGQAISLDDMLAEIDATSQLILALEVPSAEVAARLRARAKVEHRADDTQDVIAHRLALWSQEGLPLLDWYERQNRLTRINGRGDESTVADLVAATIERPRR